MNKSNVIRIDVVSDIVCPWCYIGKRRLEKAVEDTQSSNNPQVKAVEIIYRAYQLDSYIPSNGIDFQIYMQNRFGNNFVEKFHQVEQVAKIEGLNFDFSKLPKAINTFTLHRILTVALQDGIQSAVKESFMKAYFIERQDLTQERILIDLLEKCGWSAEKTLNIINSNMVADKVKAEMDSYQQLGVSGVPFFIFNQKYAISGAQPVEVFVEILEKISKEMSVDIVEGKICGIDGKNC